MVADPFAESRPRVNDFFRRLYLTLINRYPGFWNLFYVTCHHLPLIEKSVFVHQPAYLRVRELIEIHRPKVVVLTFPVYAHLIARLGEPFERLDVGRVKSISGAGLGLSITKSLLAMLGGQCKIESTEGAGTTVTIMVPAGAARG